MKKPKQRKAVDEQGSTAPGPRDSTPNENRRQGSDAKPKPSRTGKVLGALGGVFGCMIGCGYYLGQTRSINFEDASQSPPFIQKYVTDIQKYVTDHMTTRVTDRVSGVHGQDKLLERIYATEELSFVCADREFVYDVASKVRSIHPHVGDLEGVDPPRKHLDFSGTLATFIGGVGAYRLTKVGPVAVQTYDELETPGSR